MQISTNYIQIESFQSSSSGRYHGLRLCFCRPDKNDTKGRPQHELLHKEGSYGGFLKENNTLLAKIDNDQKSIKWKSSDFYGETFLGTAHRHPTARNVYFNFLVEDSPLINTWYDYQAGSAQMRCYYVSRIVPPELTPGVDSPVYQIQQTRWDTSYSGKSYAYLYNHALLMIERDDEGYPTRFKVASGPRSTRIYPGSEGSIVNEDISSAIALMARSSWSKINYEGSVEIEYIYHHIGFDTIAQYLFEASSCEDADLGSLATSALLNMDDGFSSNGDALALDLAGTANDLKKNAANVRDITMGVGNIATSGPKGQAVKSIVSAASSAYLGYHYGARLTSQDLGELRTELFNNILGGLQAKAAAASTTYNLPQRPQGYRNTRQLRILYQPYALAGQFDRAMSQLDLWPDMTNVWDMIPFSFIIDWFTNLGDCIESIDNFARLTQKHKILGTTISDHLLIELPKPANAMGTATLEIYRRQVRKDWYPLPSIRGSISTSPGVQHFIEGGTLVCANMK